MLLQAARTGSATWWNASPIALRMMDFDEEISLDDTYEMAVEYDRKQA